MGKTILVLSVFTVWCFVCQRWYVCGIKQACATAIGQTTHATIPSPAKNNINSLPIAFRWQSAEPILGDNYPKYRDSILRELGDEDILQITAHYYHTENAPTDSLTFGMLRAKELQKLFAEKIPAERIQLVQKAIKIEKGVKEKPFSALRINYVAPPEVAPEEDAPVVKLKDGVRIYFESNSSKGEMNEAIINYLDELAVNLKETGRKVRITGHTDNVGEAKANYNVGLRRAKSIRNYLREKGVARSQIQTFSKGETEPIATNETEEGKAKNRRTELKISPE